MKIAIIGTGFSGLASAWFLQDEGASVALFDEKGIGGGASGIAAGLLHPYVGEEVKRSYRADEALKESVALLESVQLFINQPVMRKGIIRYAEDKVHQNTLEEHQRVHGDVKRLSENTFWIESGYTVDCPKYLQGLFQRIQAKGGEFYKEHVASAHHLLDRGYDAVLVAAGRGCLQIEGVQPLNASLVKGQVLKGALKTLIETSLVGKGYLALGLDGTSCTLGSTYEKTLDEAVDFELCRKLLFPKILQIYPEAEKIDLIEVKGAFRVCTKGHYFPILRTESAYVWVLTGLGSRGLLYHALLAKEAACQIVRSF